MLIKNYITNRGTMGRFRILLVLVFLGTLALMINGASLAAKPEESEAFYRLEPIDGLRIITPAAGISLQQNTGGTIAYVTQSGTEIWLIEPDGSNNRRLWAMPSPDPDGINAITGLAWRPDSGALAFASTHEKYCSWYNSDIYSVAADGSGLRRVTNAPNCAALASYPKGTVTAVIENATFSSGMIGVYIQGAQQVQVVPFSPFSSTQVTFNNVADLGDVVQPVTAIYGGYRYYGMAYANVKPGQTVDAGVLTISGSGLWHMGTYKVSWRYDGASIGYTTTNCTSMYHISTNPIDGAIGDPVLNTDNVSTCVMAWGPTEARANQVLYSVTDVWEEGVDGIYLATAGSSNPGNKLVSLQDFEGESINDIKWLPDGSGFLFTKQHVDFGIMSDIFEYSFSSSSVSQITTFEDEEYALNFSISPDGQHIVFELAREFDGPTDLYIIQRDGTNMRLLVANAGHPAWSPGALQMPTFQYLFLPTIMR
jgi:hypothetical protein